jgi:hypothetical protein
MRKQIDLLEDITGNELELTGSEADLGEQFETGNFDTAILLLQVAINDSLDVRVRIVGIDDDTTEYYYPMKSVSTTEVKIDPMYFELNRDIDQTIILDFNIKGVVPYSKVKVWAGTAGATPAKITKAKICLD